MTDRQPRSGWVPWLGLGVVVVAVGCCAAAPLLGAAIVGAGVGGAVAGTVGAAMVAACAVMVTVMVMVLHRRNKARRRAESVKSSETVEFRSSVVLGPAG